MSLLDMVQQQLGAGGVERISEQIGADPQQTRSAIDMALPVLVGGLARNAQQPEGAASLDNALQQHTGTLDQVQTFFGGMGGSGAGGGLGALGAAANAFGGLGDGTARSGIPADTGIGGALGGLLGGAVGGKILGHILGGKQGTAQDGIARQSGLDAQQVGKLLMILAPIVMGALAKRKQQANLDASGVSEELRRDEQVVQQRAQKPDNPLGGILGQVFGR